jgi:trehalose 6-phosphate synthase/phosphatase
MWYEKNLCNISILQTVQLSNCVSLCCQVTLLQISVPSRTDVKEYQDLKEEMDQLVGCINGRFTTYNWSPIRYIYGCVSQDELAGFYRDAAVALVTPLRDGMASLFM